MTKPQEKIDAHTRELRNRINESVALRNEIYQKKDGSWDRLWAAMDALEDAQLAVESFQASLLVSYLELYGLLQAFVVQQDSIDHIRQTALSIPKINWRKDEPVLNDIRRLRNETTGHPAQIRTDEGIAYSNINRSSITKEYFEYILWSDAGAKQIKVNITENIASQDQELRRLISDTTAEINVKEIKFMERFSGKKVRDVYSPVNYYYFEKMYDFKNSPEIAKSMFASLQKIYTEIRKMLEERYGDFGATINAPGLKLVIDEMDELLRRINTKFTTAGQDEFDYHIYIGALEKKWEELGGMIDETDERFKQKE